MDRPTDGCEPTDAARSERIRHIVDTKREWHYRPTAAELALGFKGWRSRGYLPHFDAPGVRQFLTYRVLAWCLMPNHVHAVVEIWQTPLAELLHCWKSYTSKQANRILGRRGHFWQDEYFDRFIRDEAHLRQTVRYVENNPVKAGVARQPVEWPWSSACWRDEYCRLRLGDGSAGGPPASPRT